MKTKVLLLIIVLLIITGVFALLANRQEGSFEMFSTRQLPGKIVYSLKEKGSVEDLKEDCALRGGYFNECGSLCQKGEICAQVCVYTCELQDIPSINERVEEGKREQQPECGLTAVGRRKLCPAGEICYTAANQLPRCAKDPCLAVCGSIKNCQLLETYPVQVKCFSKDLSTNQSPKDGLLATTTPFQVSNEVIKIIKPLANQTLTSPFTIQGEVSSVKSLLKTVEIWVTDREGNVKIKEKADIHFQGRGGSFKITLTYIFSATKEGFLEIFVRDPVTNERQETVKVPVKFN